MPPRKNTRPSRTNELLNYYSKLKTDEDKIDFIFGQYSQKNIDMIRINPDEDDLMGSLSDEVFFPKTVNDQGVKVVDTERCKKAVKYFCKMMVRYEYLAGLEYKKNLDSLPENQENREVTAAYLTKYSVPGSYRELGNAIMGSISIGAPANIPLPEIIANYMDEARLEISATLTDEEREIFNMGIDLAGKDPKIFDHQSPQKCGLTKQKIREIEDNSFNFIVGSIDRNWMSDDTMDNDQVITYYQHDAERNGRMQQRYMSTDDPEKKLDFIVNGSLGCHLKTQITSKLIHRSEGNGDPFSDNEVTVTNEGLFSEAEKKEFGKCLADYLSPKKPNGTPDFDEFEKRVDALAGKYLSLRDAQGQFIQECTDKTNKQGEYSVTKAGSTGVFKKGTEYHVSEKLCPEAIKANALMQSLEDAFGSDAMNSEYVQNYHARKNIQKPLSTNRKMMRDAFNKAVEDKANEDILGSTGFFTYKETKQNSPANFESEDLNKISNKLASSMASEEKKEMSWKEPWNDINLDQLKKLDNLYSQVKDADHWYHIDSDKFKEFKSSLESAHKKYESLQNIGRNINEREKREIQSIFDNVQNKSVKYLGDKARKARGTDMGEDRYQIALSSLDVASHGKAKEIVDFHNTFRVRSGSKSVSFNDLTERSGQNSNQRKEAIKAKREAEKNKNKGRLVNDNGPERGSKVK